MNKILLSDLHFGNKNHSVDHNTDLLRFFFFVTDFAKQYDEEFEIVITGDTFQQRDKLSIYTINCGMMAIKYLAENFPRVTMIVGNHDMFYQDSRNFNSLIMFKDIPNVRIIEEYLIEGDEMYVPWLTSGEEYDDIVELTKKNKIRHMFGHFEFSTFKMNDNYTMEHGQTHRSLSSVGTVFTGHYHKRQVKDNVVYVGTPFPYDFNDANDTERGFCVVIGDDYSFVDYTQVKVISIDYKDFIDSDHVYDSETSVRVTVADKLSEKEVNALKTKMIESGARASTIQYKVQNTEAALSEGSEISVDLANVDDLVTQLITNMDDTTFDKSLLVSLYKNLI